MDSASLETVMMVVGFSLTAAAFIAAIWAGNKAWPAREQYLRTIEQTMQQVAEAVGGQFVVVSHDPQAHVVRNGLDVRVSVEIDHCPSDGVYTEITVALPPGRAWRTPRLRYRRVPPIDIDLASPEVFERHFAGARARQLTETVRKRLLQLAQQDCLVQLHDRELVMFVSMPDPSTGRRTFLTDVQRQRVLVDAVTLMAADLIAG